MCSPGCMTGCFREAYQPVRESVMGSNDVMSVNSASEVDEIVEATGSLVDSVEKLSGDAGVFMDNVGRITSVVSVMSPGMEEMSASIAQIQEMIDYIHENFAEMEEDTKTNSTYSQQISSEANKIREESLETKKEVLAMADEMEKTLSEKIAESREVEKIAALTQDILGISRQTNMLALNASIEAARAGEQGKGFAVVADRINILANNTAKTAKQIQEISSMVIERVGELAVASENMVQFLNEKTSAGYDKLVETSNGYQNSSKIMFDMMQDFAARIDMMYDKIKGANQSMHDISNASEENLDGVTQVTDVVTDLEANIGNMDAQLHELISNIKDLKEKEKKCLR